MNFYEALEISILGHYQQLSVKNTFNFIAVDLLISKASVRQILDGASEICITASHKIFMA